MAEQKFSESEHAWVEERLSAFVDDQLAALERAQLQRHLRDCARCQASLASLRWTISLVKQAPAPALPRTFALPVPMPTQSAPSRGFGFARLATVVATLLLFAVIGVDAITRLGGGGVNNAPAALQRAPQPTSIARAPEVQDQSKQESPTTSTGALFAAPQPTATALATQPAAPVLPSAVPPAPASAPTAAPAAPTAVLGLGAGPESAETSSPTVKSAASPPPRAPAVAPRATLTGTTAPVAGAANLATPVPSSPTVTVPTPTATATVALPSPTATARSSPTPNAQAYAVPTAAPAAQPPSETAPRNDLTLRAAEIGLFFLAVFFAAVTFLSRRK
ncbi:MAG TPA: zf-HC2 domain-containing protein [Anaerolineae bacterium]